MEDLSIPFNMSYYKGYSCFLLQVDFIHLTWVLCLAGGPSLCPLTIQSASGDKGTNGQSKYSFSFNCITPKVVSSLLHHGFQKAWSRSYNHVRQTVLNSMMVLQKCSDAWVGLLFNLKGFPSKHPKITSLCYLKPKTWQQLNTG